MDNGYNTDNMASLYDVLRTNYKLKSGLITTVRKGEENDSAKIAQLYRDVLITPDNIDIKLDPKSEDSFKSRGGLFDRMPIDAIRESMGNKKHLFILATSNNDMEVNASFSFRADHSELDGINMNIEDVEEKNEFVQALAKNQVFTVVEGIVSEKYQGEGIVYPLFYQSYNLFLNKNYKFIVFQIYNIRGEYINGIFNPLDIPHSRSIKMTKNQGAFEIGWKDIPIKLIGNRYVDIVSYFYAIKLEYAIGILEQKCRIY